MTSMHAYEKLPLFSTGLVLGCILVVLHLALLIKSNAAIPFLRKFHRNEKLGRVLLGIGLVWFWLLLAPEGKGIFSFLAMDMTEFNPVKPYLRWLTPLIFIAVATSITEYLAVRALGLLGLLFVQPFLEAAFLEAPTTRLLIPIWCYALITASLFWAGMPYTFRNLITWATATTQRWNTLCIAGAAYGVAIITCALLFWKGF